MTYLYEFTGGADGRYPFAGVVRDANGVLYGETTYGGAAPSTHGQHRNGCGTLCTP